MKEDRPILLFDGVCNLCNSITRFVIRHDPQPGRFRFAALQSRAGQQLLQNHGLPAHDPDSFVMIDGGRAFTRSTAALRVCRKLGLPWSMLYPLISIPRPLRDMVYRFIARHRYGWFGRSEQCIIPTPEIRSRFLDDAE
jgi:predicted DCC family thiol-disulfide oxidoreductase YuxK